MFSRTTCTHKSKSIRQTKAVRRKRGRFPTCFVTEQMVQGTVSKSSGSGDDHADQGTNCTHSYWERWRCKCHDTRWGQGNLHMYQGTVVLDIHWTVLRRYSNTVYRSAPWFCCRQPWTQDAPCCWHPAPMWRGTCLQRIHMNMWLGACGWQQKPLLVVSCWWRDKCT